MCCSSMNKVYFYKSESGKESEVGDEFVFLQFVHI